jgi:putative tricarboxylic transport membrane protein
VVERLLALAVLAASGVYVATALTLARGTVARPGPGFFPLAVGVFGAAVALAWAATSLRRAPATGRAAEPAADGRARVGITVGLLAAYCLLLPWTGYPLAAFLFTGMLLRGLGARWPAALAIGVAGAVASYYLFAVLLDVPLPPGVLLD